MLLVVDLLGTFVFAVEGASAGIQANLDLLGLMVVGFATALGGGIIRDLLIGAGPSEFNSRLAISNGSVFRRRGCILFLPTGQPGSRLGDYRFRCRWIGIICGCGSGQGSRFWYTSIYRGFDGRGHWRWRRHDTRRLARPHSNGSSRRRLCDCSTGRAAVLVLGLSLKMNPKLMTILGAVTCFALRVVSVWRHWNLPRLPH